MGFSNPLCLNFSDHCVQILFLNAELPSVADERWSSEKYSYFEMLNELDQW